jgi:hypothetical protein
LPPSLRQGKATFAVDASREVQRVSLLELDGQQLVRRGLVDDRTQPAPVGGRAD